MTRNQVMYLQHLETQRANLASEATRRYEAQTSRQQAETARELGFLNYGEAVRSHQQAELHQNAVLGEQQRANLAQEQYRAQSLDESIRHNMQSEQVARMQAEVSSFSANTQRMSLYEQQRHNEALEIEQSRANRANEQLRAQQQAEAERANRVHEQQAVLQLDETRRANQVREQETYRSNLQREIEQHRSNVASETERSRANKANEALTSSQQQIQIRDLERKIKYDSASLALQQSQIAENSRANRAREAENRRANVANENLQRNQQQLQQSHNIAMEVSERRRIDEQIRHNRETESVAATEAGGHIAGTIINGVRQFIPLLGG